MEVNAGFGAVKRKHRFSHLGEKRNRHNGLAKYCARYVHPTGEVALCFYLKATSLARPGSQRRENELGWRAAKQTPFRVRFSLALKEK